MESKGRHTAGRGRIVTVSELIEELKRMPQHHPVRVIDGEITNIRYGSTLNGKLGPCVYIDYDYDGDEE
jgi:hypothetical protein